MKVWYNVEVQMLGANEMTEQLAGSIIYYLGCRFSDIDEREGYRMTALFKSDTTLSDMRRHVAEILRDHPEVYYVDVIYRYDSENVPDRFVMWQDGCVQEYTGKIVFEEDK